MHRFKIDGMTCGHCASTIETAVKDIDPAAVIAIDLPTKEVRVDSTVESARIADAIREAGYESEKLAA